MPSGGRRPNSGNKKKELTIATASGAKRDAGQILREQFGAEFSEKALTSDPLVVMEYTGKVFFQLYLNLRDDPETFQQSLEYLKQSHFYMSAAAPYRHPKLSSITKEPEKKADESKSSIENLKLKVFSITPNTSGE